MSGLLLCFLPKKKTLFNVAFCTNNVLWAFFMTKLTDAEKEVDLHASELVIHHCSSNLQLCSCSHNTDLWRLPFTKWFITLSWIPLAIDFISKWLCSAQLVAFSYRGNQQMGFFDKGQWGGCCSIPEEQLNNTAFSTDSPALAGQE